MSAPGVEELARRLEAEGRTFALMYFEETDDGRTVYVTHTTNGDSGLELLDIVRELERAIVAKRGDTT